MLVTREMGSVQCTCFNERREGRKKEESKVKEVTKQLMCIYEAFMLYLVTSFVVLHTTHTCLLVTSTYLVAVPRQDSIRTCKHHAVLSRHCNYYVQY